MLSLAYRIATMEVRMFNYGKPLPDDDVKARIKTLPKIQLGNIERYYWEYWGKNNPLEIPNWAPVFSGFWAEWTRYNAPTNGGFIQYGCHVACGPIEDTEATWGDAFPGVESVIADCKWVMMIVPYTSSSIAPLSGQPLRLPLTSWVFIRENGSSAGIYTLDRKDHQEDLLSIMILNVLGLGISFMHCKNVRQVETKIDPGERFRKQYKVPKYTYRTLQIDPMKEVLRREGRSDTEGLQRALHICRGHFSTYSEDKPLFGKYPGTFWVPDHVRGSKERGEVVKDYDVKPVS
jgi:hypothetical protein